MLILEDPLEQFHRDEAKEIMDYVSQPSQPWSLIVVSNNDIWKANCNTHIVLNKGAVSNIYNKR